MARLVKEGTQRRCRSSCLLLLLALGLCSGEEGNKGYGKAKKPAVLSTACREAGLLV